METKANHLLIGGFVLTMALLAFGFIYWLQNSAAGRGAKNYHVIFEGSVGGLTEASNVLFNGIRVGAVDSLQIMPEDTRKVRAVISVRRDTPVKENSRARIEQQGLAGLVALEITPGANGAPPLTAKNGAAYPILYADAAISSGLSGASDALGNANALFVRLNDLVANNEASISRTLKSMEAFTNMLDQNKDDITAIIKEARGLSGRFAQLSEKLEAAVTKFTDAMTDDGSGKSVVAQAQQAAQSFKQLAEKLEKSLGDQADGLSKQAQRGLKEFELFMKDGRRLAENLDRLVQKIERNPSSLIWGGSQSPEYTPNQ